MSRGQVKTWKWARDLRWKNMEDFFRQVHKAMNVIQPLVFVFVALPLILLYACHVATDLSNMEVHFWKIKQHKVKALTPIEMWWSYLIISVILLLFV